MNQSQGWNAIPKAVRKAAWVLVGLGGVAGLVFGLILEPDDFRFARLSVLVPVLELFVFVGVGLVIGAGVAAYLLALGYVYGDARLRFMPAGVWTLVALLVPGLMGFLVYLLVRNPLGMPCAHCGQPVEADRPCCSWCGSVRTNTPYPGAASPAGRPPWDPTAAI